MSVTKGSVQYLHMQECLVYAAVDVSQQTFERASMFRYGNKTQAFTKIRRLQGRDDRTSQGRHGASINTWTLRVVNAYTHAVVHTYTYMYVCCLFCTLVFVVALLQHLL